tara:strand:+ start:1573 stop:1683 length:111 start_codon:yes stop_codon:yes gene_type:complete
MKNKLRPIEGILIFILLSLSIIGIMVGVVMAIMKNQ